MSEHDRLQQQCRVWLYVIALLHLVCLGLIHRPLPGDRHAGSPYAERSAIDRAAPPPTAPRRT
jgi:hypothetical protein